MVDKTKSIANARTYKQKFNKKYGQKLSQPNGKQDIARLTGVSKGILDKVFYRGVGAFNTNRAAVRPSVKSAEQWAYARIYSFVGGGKTQKTADADLWKQHLKNRKRRKTN